MTASVNATAPNGADILERARGLSSQIRAARAEGEGLRRTPDELARLMTEAGVFQLYLPKSVSGPELSPLEAFQVIEEVSKADGSAGWCAMIASDIALITGWLPQDTLRDMAGDQPDLRGAGSLRPGGEAQRVDGGYKVSGRWTFASGIDHANWLYCPAFIKEGGKPVLNAAGTPTVRAMWMPACRANLLDTWHTVGMRATGSQDFTVEGAFVPDAYTCFLGEPPVAEGPLYNPRFAFVNFFGVIAANALGIGRGAIEEFTTLATAGASTMSTTLLRDRPRVQDSLGHAEAIISAARAYVVAAIGEAWEAAKTGKPDPSQEIAHARLAIAHAVHESVRAVDIIFHAAGTNAIYVRNPIERHFRDVHVAAQHNAAFPVYCEHAGKVFLGLRPEDQGW